MTQMETEIAYLRNKDLGALEEKVSLYLRDGWQLYGSLVVSQSYAQAGSLSQSSPLYIQTVTKEFPAGQFSVPEASKVESPGLG